MFGTNSGNNNLITAGVNVNIHMPAETIVKIVVMALAIFTAFFLTKKAFN